MLTTVCINSTGLRPFWIAYPSVKSLDFCLYRYPSRGRRKGTQRNGKKKQRKEETVEDDYINANSGA